MRRAESGRKKEKNIGRGLKDPKGICYKSVTLIPCVVVRRGAVNGPPPPHRWNPAEFRPYLKRCAKLFMPRQLLHIVDESDLAQITMLEADRSLGAFKGQTVEAFQGWLRQMLRHNVADAVRRARRRGELRRGTGGSTFLKKTFDHLENQEASPSSVARRKETSDRVADVLLSLPIHYQRVIQLRQFDNLQFSEIGAMMGRSSEAARQLWVRAIEEMKERLNPHEA